MKNHKGNMLLIELVIVILFFALSQFVIVQVFAETQQRNLNTNRLNQSIVFVENIIERLCNERDPEEILLKANFIKENGIYIHTLLVDVMYRAKVSIEKQTSGELVSVELSAIQGDNILYTIPSVQYFTKEASHE